MRIKEIIDRLEAWAPSETAESYDNPGLQIGRPDAEVSGVIVGLDLTPDLITQALRAEANLIITHHPLFFAPIKSLTPSSLVGAMALRLAEQGIAHYAIHTNLDAARGGVSFALARQLGLERVDFLETRDGEAAGTGLGAIGALVKAMPIEEFLVHVAESLNLAGIRHVSRAEATIRRVAVCGGSGSSFLSQALDAGADAYVTADVKYHQFFDALDPAGNPRLAYLDVGHYESERITEQLLVDYLAGDFPDLPVHRAAASTSPISQFVRPSA